MLYISIAENVNCVKAYPLDYQIFRCLGLLCTPGEQVDMALVLHLAHLCFERGSAAALVSGLP